MSSKVQAIHIYTDGASRGNPGPSGWAGIIFHNPENGVIELGGGEEYATNNRMELMAVYKALSYIDEHKIFEHPITVFIDSAYVQKGLTSWMYVWEKNGWKTKEGSAVLNQDLWSELVFLVFRLKTKMTVIFEKIEGHKGHFGNERADSVATSFADGKKTLLFKGDIVHYKRLYGTFTVPVAHVSSQIKKEVSKNVSKKAYSYVSLVGGIISIDKDWATCSKRVTGKKSARYKKVFSKVEENRLVDEYKKSH